ncbi:UvrD-helicase domain-containing protein [Aeromicrobium sp.]|uniref:UvrD-helicase domain-containing protein n=1 Tax=Aeromicrobium sp. TaxID=1871063 RepID=UPI003D6B307A
MSPVRDEQHLCELLGIDFTAPQLAAITADVDEPGVIIAGAGSGKTTVMAARVVWLVGHLEEPPDRVLGLTFTNKAAAELGQRIRASLQVLGADDAGEPTTSTYHAFAGSLITEHGLRLGVEPDLRVVTDASRFQRMARAIESYRGDLREVTTHVPSLVTQAMALDAQLAEHLVEPEVMRAHDDEVIREFLSAPAPQAVLRDAAATAQKRIELSHLVDRYRAGKADDGVMDFSDQMAWGARLAFLPEVGAALRERFGIVLLDEYQDTSVAQRDLLQALFSGADGSSGRGFPVTAVGDPAQAIYGWRGAAVGNLEHFLDDFPRADGGRGRQFSLNETRRCAPEIIDMANHVAAPFFATSEVVRPLASATMPGGRVDVALYGTIDAEIDAMVDDIKTIDGPRRDIAILVRVARENGAIVQALRDAHIPFEIVGLEGLLSQPEVLDLLALLEVVEDVTANPALLRLLTGPRWRIGPRDLALLGRRAAHLSGRTFGRDDDTTLEAELKRAVEGTDPTEIVSLADAVDDPGDLAYSVEARERLAEVSRLVSSVRAHVGEPLLDLARRGVRALDLDLELQAGDVAGGADNIALLLEAVADYSHTDRYASLSGLVAYLDAERFFAGGMEVSTPSEADSVKLLTIHRAKGLEWPTVFVPLTSRTIFPSGRGRPRWITSASTLPGPLRGDADSLPALADWTAAAKTAYERADRDDALMEERRLAYVAFTRAARRLTVTGHYWGRTQKKPLGPSEFLLVTRARLESRGVPPIHWADPPVDGETNPHLAEADGIAWPVAGPGLDRRRSLAHDVRAAIDGRLTIPTSEPESAEADRTSLDELEALENDLDLLVAEAADSVRDVRAVPWPPRVSATSAMALTKDPDEFARSLARPMPRRPSPAARFGTRFHAWIEDHYGMAGLFDPTDLPGRGDVGIDNDTELDRLKQMFLASEFADRAPDQIEAPFSLVLGGQQFGGRIDAVFSSMDADGAKSFEVVDWKTNMRADADPLQLAIYRLAWAELTGIDVARVTAAFYYVRLGETVRYGPDELLDRAGLEQVLGFGTSRLA